MSKAVCRARRRRPPRRRRDRARHRTAGIGCTRSRSRGSVGQSGQRLAGVAVVVVGGDEALVAPPQPDPTPVDGRAAPLLPDALVGLGGDPPAGQSDLRRPGVSLELDQPRHQPRGQRLRHVIGAAVHQDLGPGCHRLNLPELRRSSSPRACAAGGLLGSQPPSWPAPPRLERPSSPPALLAGSGRLRRGLLGRGRLLAGRLARHLVETVSDATARVLAASSPTGGRPRSGRATRRRCSAAGPAARARRRRRRPSAAVPR